MKLPNTSTLPAWAFDMALAAGDELPECHSVETARAQLTDLKTALMNPHILYALGQVCAQLLENPVTIENAQLNGTHDIYTREQVIGETRGLRRFILELDEAFTKLRQLADSLPSGGA